MPSSVIRSMRYEPLKQMMEIVFRGGRGAYRYFDVPMEEWRRFRDAPSKGTYLNESFKAKEYRYEKVPVKRDDVAGTNEKQVFSLRQAQGQDDKHLGINGKNLEGDDRSWGENSKVFEWGQEIESSLRRSVSL